MLFGTLLLFLVTSLSRSLCKMGMRVVFGGSDRQGEAFSLHVAWKALVLPPYPSQSEFSAMYLQSIVINGVFLCSSNCQDDSWAVHTCVDVCMCANTYVMLV